MSHSDKEKWDKKYTEMQGLLERRLPSELLSAFFENAPGRRALDLACGSGRHTLFLAENGFDVDAVDLSTVALEALRSAANTDRVSVIEADLDTYVPAPGAYDLIVITNFLDRALMKRAEAALKPGGVMIVETYMADARNERADANPDFLLADRELLTIFGTGFTVLDYREGWNSPQEKYRMRTQGIAVRKT